MCILAIPSKPHSFHSVHSAVWSRMNGMIFRSFRKQNRSQRNTNNIYSKYSYSGIVPKECALSLQPLIFVFIGAQGIPIEHLSVIHNGHLISEDTKVQLQAGDVCYTALRLPGGKGGFGSMLRALGAQIEKTTNREACRDLSGRRMRDINDEKK